MGNERAGGFVPNGAELDAPESSDVAAVAIQSKLFTRVAKSAATVLALFPAPKVALRPLGAAR